MRTSAFPLALALLVLLYISGSNADEPENRSETAAEIEPIAVHPSGSPAVDALVLDLVSRRPAPYPAGFRPPPEIVDPALRYCTPEVDAAMEKLRRMGPRIFPALVKHWRDDRYSHSIIVAAWNNQNVGDAVVGILQDNVDMRSSYKSRQTPSGAVGMPFFEDYLVARRPGKWAEWAQNKTRLEIQLDFIDWSLQEEIRRGFLHETDREQMLRSYETTRERLRGHYSKEDSPSVTPSP
jgi:hypothetical protein